MKKRLLERMGELCVMGCVMGRLAWSVAEIRTVLGVA